MDGSVAVLVTGGVAVAGYLFNFFSSSRDRTEARALAKDAQEHDLMTRDNAQAHDLELRRRERAYKSRKAAYESALQWALLSVQQVQLTDPLLRYEGMPDPPENRPGLFDQMIVELSVFAPQQVEDALDAFRESITTFEGRQMVVNGLREQPGAGDRVEAYTARDEARTAVADAFETFRRTMRDDLAAL